MTAQPVQSAQTPSGSHPLRWPYVVLSSLHLLAALSGPVFAYVSWYFYYTPDANIGYGLGLLWATVWGLPWSLWPLNGMGQVSISIEIGVFTACALLNVALVATVFLVRYQRAAKRMSSQA